MSGNTTHIIGSSTRAYFVSMLLISIGVIVTNTSSVPSAGIVLIANGGLFLIVAMHRRKRETFRKN